MKRSKFSTLFALHLMLMLYSMSEICSKKAAGESFLSVRYPGQAAGCGACHRRRDSV